MATTLEIIIMLIHLKHKGIYVIVQICQIQILSQLGMKNPEIQ